MADILAALHFKPWTFIMMAFNLLIVALVLNKLVYKPVSKLLEEREQKIEGSLRDAALAKQRAEEQLKEYEARMQSARQEAQEIIARAQKLGAEMQESIVNQAREEARKTMEKAKAEIQGEKAKALAAIREEVATLAVLAAGRVIGRSLTPADHERLVQEFIAEVGEVQ